MRIEAFEDVAVIYHSAEDGCWIAHSLRTDQIGTGVDMGRALADLIRGVDQLMEIAREDESVAIFREAAVEIKDRAAMGTPLPREVYEVAHKLARGTWPPSIETEFNAPDDQSFTATFREEIPC